MSVEDARPEPMRPHPSRLAEDHPNFAQVMAAHDAAVRAGEQMYPDPKTGLWVLTAATHLARGSCCNSGCRHCPYVA